ncbi:MAG: amidophosphoribosyltransferase [bacterium]|nr:amidophosphoribosyltransferase [bacterium]
MFKHECGVVGIVSELKNTSYDLYFALRSLQHRGQESAGITVYDGKSMKTIKGMGLVDEVFGVKELMELKGYKGIGHVRYSTTGKSTVENAQPIFARTNIGHFALVHNGNLINYRKLRKGLEKRGAIFLTDSDSELILHLLAFSGQSDIISALKEILHKVKGAFSFIIMTPDLMLGVRDPYGFRPLVLGETEHGPILASESCAITLLKGKIVRDINPGEVVVIQNKGNINSFYFDSPTPKMCIFEYIYFARPDSYIFGQNVHEFRVKLGEQLAKEVSIDADKIIPIPDSGISASLGFSRESGIPYDRGLIRDHYTGRTFINPSPKDRSFKVRMKLNPIKSTIEGKKIILLDDSIVRGTTSKIIINLIREFNPKKVVFLSASPMIKNPCYYGIDTPSRNELIAAKKTNEEIRKYLNADELHYLSLEGLKKIAGTRCDSFCYACFNGEYPVKADYSGLSKNIKACEGKQIKLF